MSISHKTTCGILWGYRHVAGLRCALGSTTAQMLLVTLKTTNSCLDGGNRGLGKRESLVRGVWEVTFIYLRAFWKRH